MTFFEAIAHLRKNGGRVALRNTHGTSSEAVWRDGVMQWANTCYPVASCPTTIDGEWFIVQPPPKLYTFVEAYAMMKAGKWMRTVGSNDCRYKVGECWMIKQIGCNVSYKFDRFPIEEIESKWIEVTP